MARCDSNPFDEEVNPFANPGGVPPVNSKIKPISPKPYDRSATIDIPLDSEKDLLAKEKELQAKEAELKKREQELKRKEDAIARTGVVIEEKTWPAFFSLIHHDIPNKIPMHLQKDSVCCVHNIVGYNAWV